MRAESIFKICGLLSRFGHLNKSENAIDFRIKHIYGLWRRFSSGRGVGNITHREDMNEIEVSVLVVKATYKVNRLYGMIQNIFLRDAKQLSAMVQPIAIGFRRIFLASPTVLLFQTRKQSTARKEKETENTRFCWAWVHIYILIPFREIVC